MGQRYVADIHLVVTRQSYDAEMMSTGTYKMIKWKSQILNIFVLPVEKVVASKRSSFINVLRAINWLKHGTDDDVGIDDCEIEGGLFGFEKIPSCLFGELLRDIVP